MSGTGDLELLLWIAPALSAGLLSALWFRLACAQDADIPVGVSGFAVARHVLDSAGLLDVSVEPTPGHLSDHYDLTAVTVRLSNAVYHGRSVVAVAVAACVAGHALQHRASLRSALLHNVAAVAASFGSGPGLLIAGIGFLFSQQALVLTGVVLVNAVFILQVLSLPVRLDACRRARRHMAELGLFELAHAASVERIMTASALTSLGVVLRPVAVLLHSLTSFFSGDGTD
jgi:Zn-dependent membrane protease YugP